MEPLVEPPLESTPLSWRLALRVASVAGMLVLHAVMMPTAAWSASAWKPDQRIEIVVGVSAGAASDTTARWIHRLLTEKKLLDATLAATDIVIASPVYWYSISAATKLYLDHWSAWMRLEGVDFKARMASKTLWAISALSDEDWSGAQPLIDTLRLSAEYMKMKWGGVLLGYGNRPRDVLNDTPSLERAETFFENLVPA